MRPVLLIDVEGGTKSIRNIYPEVDILRVKTIHDKAGRVKKSAWEQLEDIYELAKKGELPYETFILDSLSEIYWLYMQHWMSDVVIEHPERDADVPAQRDWGKATSRIKKFIRQYRDLDKHVIFTAFRNTKSTEAGVVLNHTPSLPGKLAFDVVGFMDEVFYLYTKSDKEGTRRIILTENSNKFLAKDRSDNLPQTLENPTMGKIAEAVLD